MRLNRGLYIRLTALLIGFSALPERAHAVPACPTPATLKQPDGTPITVYLRGDEYKHWHEDRNGFSIVREPKTKQWRYATRDNTTGRLKPSDLVVGRDNPQTLNVPPGLQPTASARPLRTSSAPLNAISSKDGANQTQSSFANPMHNLVVLVEFSDLAHTYTTNDFDALFNEIGYSTDGAQGSVRDYYNEVSYGQFAVTSTIANWVTLGNGYAYYGANDALGWDLRPQQMVEEALAALEARGFDFTTVDGNGDGAIDGLTVIHAGGGEEYSGNDANYIWSHQWQLTSTVTYDGVTINMYHTEPERRGWDSTATTWGITRIGVVCHETGHFLGLPDLYDTDYSSSGVGDFCLMSGASWNGNSGTLPGHMSAWCKVDLGWVTPTVVTDGGSYTANRASMNAQAYRLDRGFSSTEYFLIENRCGGGFDAGLPGSSRGLLIWHIDETQTDNDNENHLLVDLEEAEGTQDLQAGTSAGDDADYFRQSNNTRFSGNTSPDSDSYSSTPLDYAISDVSSAGNSMWFMVSPFLLQEPSLLWESCLPTNGAVDEDEAVMMEIPILYNNTKQVDELVITLQSTNGITPYGDPVDYGPFTGPAETQNDTFLFTANGTCGDTLTLIFTLAADGEYLGALQHQLVLGTSSVIDSQSFDSSPGFPSGWSTTTTGGGIAWTTTTTVNDTSPRSCFAAEATTIGTTDLLSESFTPSSANAILRFRQQYDIEHSDGAAWDGGVLDISINGGAFADVISAGGEFLSHGYTDTIATGYSNPEAGRSAWSGTSGGFVTTDLRLPAAAAGKSIQMRWRLATDSSIAETGWWVDTVELMETTCCSNLPATLSIASSEIDFGDVTLGTSSNIALKVMNNGQQRLLGTASTAGAFALASNSWYTVEPSATGTVTVSFTPSDAQSYSNTLLLTSNGGDESRPLLGAGQLLWLPTLGITSGTSLVVRTSSTNGDASLWFKTDLTAPAPWQLYTNATRELDGSNYLFELPYPPANSNLFIKVLSDPVE